MENAIKYYYNINPVHISRIDKGFLFEFDQEYYYLERNIYDNKKIKQVYELDLNLIKNNILVHEIILNIFKNIVTNIDDKQYILMRINVDLNKSIDLHDIAYFSYICKNLVTDKPPMRTWGERWSKKIDYYEQQAIEIGKKYPVAMEAFSYYIGLAENSIMYVNSIVSDIPDISYCHIRFSDSALEFYNPFNLIIDYKIRDLSEYLKNKFFEDKLDYDEIKKYILYNKLSSSDIKYFYARMLFPTYFFDIFEGIMDGTQDDKKISFIVKKNKEYERFLCGLHVFLSNFTNLEEIEWLKKAINQY